MGYVNLPEGNEEIPCGFRALGMPGISQRDMLGFS